MAAASERGLLRSFREDIDPLSRGYIGRDDSSTLNLRKESEDASEGIRFDLSQGVAPFGLHPDLEKRLRERDSVKEVQAYADIDISPAFDFMQTRWPQLQDQFVGFGDGGSNEYLSRTVLALKPNSDLWAFGPHFPGIYQAVKIAGGGRSYGPISPDSLDIPYDDVIIDVMKKHRKGKIPSAIYIADPNAKGETASTPVKKELVDFCTDREIILIWDRALEDFIEDEESVVPLLKDNPGLIIVGSFSKIGLPGTGLGYIFASKPVGRHIQQVVLEHDLRNEGRSFLLGIADPEPIRKKNVFYKHLDFVRHETRANKAELMIHLDDKEVRYLPTDPRTPFLIVRSEQELVRKLKLRGIETVPGAGFYNTYVPKSDNRPINNLARVTVPPNIEDIPVIAEIIGEEAV